MNTALAWMTTMVSVHHRQFPQVVAGNHATMMNTASADCRISMGGRGSFGAVTLENGGAINCRGFYRVRSGGHR